MSKKLDRTSLCGNCKHFVAGGKCKLVQGSIQSDAICDLHEFGAPLPIDTKIEPRYEKSDVGYKIKKIKEIMAGEIAQKAIQMEHELLARGISEEEVHRAVIAYFSSPEPPPAMPWPGPVTGLDLAGRLDPFKVPDTGEPLTDFRGLPADVQPYPTPNKSPYGIGGGPEPYPSNPTPDPNSLGSLSNTYDVLNPSADASSNWLGLASDVNSEPSMHGEYGFNVVKAVPEWRYDVEQSQTYPLKIPDIILPPSGAIMEISFEFNETVEEQREKDFNATSSFVGRVNYTPELQTMEITLNGKRYDYCKIPERVFDSFRSASSKGAFYNRDIKGVYACGFGETTRKKLQETTTRLREEFGWLTDDYIESAKKMAEENGGVLYLIRAAGETITDHRGEGEPYKRKLSAQELNDMTRTIITKSMDINHQPEYQTDAIILDADFDKKRREMQTLVMETDPEIIQAIDDGVITAVSINGGMPRSESVEPCNHGCTDGSCELCLVPKGVVLGELDGIGMTYVVTDNNGLYWNGHFIPKAEPGVKFTKIEAL